MPPLQAFLAFLRRPTDRPAPITSPRTCVRALFILLAVDLLATLILGGLIGLLSEASVIELDNHAVADVMGNMPLPALLLVVAIATPLLEELIFRLPLTFRYNLFARLLMPKASPSQTGTAAPSRRAGWDRNYGFVFYALTIAFAYLHLMNYPDWSLGLLLVSPILVAPQFVMGAMAGFLRVRFGFWWGFLLHALHNLILLGLALLPTVFPTKVIEIDRADYRLSVEEFSPLGNPNEMHFQSADSLDFSTSELHHVVARLIEPGSDVPLRPQEGVENPHVNITMVTKLPGTNLRPLLLEELQNHYQFEVIPPASDSGAYALRPVAEE